MHTPHGSVRTYTGFVVHFTRAAVRVDARRDGSRGSRLSLLVDVLVD